MGSARATVAVGWYVLLACAGGYVILLGALAVSPHACKPPRAWVPPAGKLRGVHLLMSPARAGMQRSISTMQAQNSAYLVVPNAGVDSERDVVSGIGKWLEACERRRSKLLPRLLNTEVEHDAIAQIEDLWDLFGI